MRDSQGQITVSLGAKTDSSEVIAGGLTDVDPQSDIGMMDSINELVGVALIWQRLKNYLSFALIFFSAAAAANHD
jgi:hypothetical protein